MNLRLPELPNIAILTCKNPSKFLFLKFQYLLPSTIKSYFSKFMAEYRHNKTSKGKTKAKVSCLGRQEPKAGSSRPKVSRAAIEDMEGMIDVYNVQRANDDIFETLDNDAENPMEMCHPLKTERLNYCHISMDYKNKGNLKVK